MNGNPFIFGKPVPDEDFYNREEETEVAIGFLKKLQSFSIVGERRIGKTSFLIHILSRKILEEKGVDPDKYVLVHINVGGMHEVTIDALIQSIVEKITEQTQIDLECEDIFEKLVACVGKLASDERNLVIALDEFEAISPILDDHFSHWLRSLFQKPNMMAITATQTTVGNLGKGQDMISPLFNIFANIFLKPFSEKDTEDMINEMFQRGHIEIGNEEVSFLSDLSGGNPYLIQLLGYYYYEEKKKGREIDQQGFQDTMMDYVTDQFEGYWNHLEKDEREFLLRLESQDDWVGYVLERKGFLKGENEELKVHSRLFERFLQMKRKEMTHEDEKKKKERYPFAKIMSISALLIMIVISLSMFVNFAKSTLSVVFIAIPIILITILVLCVPFSYIWRR
jgi:AcrR family transcriptional regulator